MSTGVDHIVGHLAEDQVDTSSASTAPTSEELYTRLFPAGHHRPCGPARGFPLRRGDATVAAASPRPGPSVSATSGGGARILFPACESFTSRIPGLALVGQPATTMDGLGRFQDTSGRNGSLNDEAFFSQFSCSAGG